MNLHLHNMSGEEMGKIFPQPFCAKYANHLKILQFEKAIMQEASKSKVKFQSRGRPHTGRARTAVPKQQTKKTRMSFYDTYEEAITKNKQELRRIASLNVMLQLKLRATPRKNIIRTPARQPNELQQSVYLRMKAIEDMDFERREQTRREQRIELEKRSICKFVNKCHTVRGSNNKIRTTSKANPEGKTHIHRNIASKLSEIAMESLERNSSINLTATKATQRDATYISTLNTAIKKSNSILRKAGVNQRQEQKILKLFRQRATCHTSLGFQDKKARKDLVAQTERIRKESRSMATLRRYDVVLEKRAAEKDLNSQ